MTFGMEGSLALRRYRNSRKLTQDALAKELGVTSITVSRWETGDRKIATSKLQEVSDKTGISKRELRPDLAELIGSSEC